MTYLVITDNLIDNLDNLEINELKYEKIKSDEISNNIKEATERVAGKGNVKVVVTHTPPFSRDMLSEEAKLILNL